MSRAERRLNRTIKDIIQGAKTIRPVDDATRARVLERAYGAILVGRVSVSAGEPPDRLPRPWRTILVDWASTRRRPL